MDPFYQARLRFPAGILRNPVFLFFKLLGRNCDSAPAGKLPGARPENRSVWSSVEIDIGFKNKYTSYFCPKISMLLFVLTAAAALPLPLPPPSCRCRCAERRHRNAVAAVLLPSCLRRAGANAALLLRHCCRAVAAAKLPRQ